MDNKTRLAIALREGGHVERMHIVPHHCQYSVAQHSWNMAMLLFSLHPDPSIGLVQAILEHDVAERWTGDMPGPAKHWINPELGAMMKDTENDIQKRLGIVAESELSDEERVWLKALDQVEFLMFCEDDLAMGNRHVLGSIENVKELLRNMGEKMPKEIQEFLGHYEWERTNDRFCLGTDK